MGKRKLYVLLILMAGFIVLTHAVTTHHHHQGTFCTETAHDHHDKADSCSLETAILLPQDQTRTDSFDVKFFHDIPLLSDPYLLVLIHSHFGKIQEDPEVLYASFLLSVSFLRGPPAA